ncbi:integrase [Clostridium beijerinckii]|uniref:site-specific integrase n=1 Tax=Clostridium beijerinckii TaxID=1520 RepID=UPI00156F413A|nr:site-specific integrase [Clostridium beijerinckii]NRZ60377.1 integrase [Clostridium beijerinckii]
MIRKENNSFFCINDINGYIELFDKYKDKKVIQNKFFSDNVWILSYDNNQKKHCRRISFNQISKEYQILIKSMILKKLNDKRILLPATLVVKYKCLIKVIEEIGELNEKNLEKYDDYLYEHKHKSSFIDKLRTAFFDLMNFTNNTDINLYFYLTTNYYNSEIHSKARDLPDFKSILIFDTRINDVFPKLNSEYKLKYYMIYIWWNLTMIIPLRPNEFLKLKYECCWKDSDGKYWIHVPRSKVEDEKAKIKLVYELQCSREIFEIIENYKVFIKQYIDGTTKLLFPFKLRYKTFNNKQKKISDRLRINKNDQNNHDGNCVLAKFEETYLSNELEGGQYSHITLGDTRHYAFCNMILQGLNPLVIAQIGGHTSLDAQLHYYNHIENCTNAYTKELAYRYRIKNHKILCSLDKYNEAEFKSRTLSQLYKDNELLEIEKGHCLKYRKNDDKIDFSECGEECYECENFIADFKKYPEMRELYQEKSNEYQNILDKQLAIIKYISNDLKKDIEVKNNQNIVNPMNNSELLNTGHSLINNINKKAILDGNLLEFILK